MCLIKEMKNSFLFLENKFTWIISLIGSVKTSNVGFWLKRTVTLSRSWISYRNRKEKNVKLFHLHLSFHLCFPACSWYLIFHLCSFSLLNFRYLPFVLFLLLFCCTIKIYFLWEWIKWKGMNKWCPFACAGLVVNR